MNKEQDELKPSKIIHKITLDLIDKNHGYINDKNMYLHLRITGLINYLDECHNRKLPVEQRQEEKKELSLIELCAVLKSEEIKKEILGESPQQEPREECEPSETPNDLAWQAGYKVEEIKKIKSDTKCPKCGCKKRRIGITEAKSIIDYLENKK